MTKSPIITKEHKDMLDRIVVGSPKAAEPLTEKERQQALEAIKKSRVLREAMLKRRKAKLVPDSTPLIRQAREKEM